MKYEDLPIIVQPRYAAAHLVGPYYGVWDNHELAWIDTSQVDPLSRDDAESIADELNATE